MRKPHEIAIDRALLLCLLRLVEPHGSMSDVKVQHLMFLCELKLFDQQLKGLHLEFFRYAYGVFSKDLDNDLLWLRKKERLENFTVPERAQGALKVFSEVLEANETNRQIGEIVNAVVVTYAAHDASTITAAVEAIELSTPEQPHFKVAIRDISFHTTLLVPARIEVKAELTLPAPFLTRLNAALGVS
jgi:hypothetical protein